VFLICLCPIFISNNKRSIIANAIYHQTYKLKTDAKQEHVASFVIQNIRQLLHRITSKQSSLIDNNRMNKVQSTVDFSVMRLKIDDSLFHLYSRGSRQFHQCFSGLFFVQKFSAKNYRAKT